MQCSVTCAWTELRLGQYTAQISLPEVGSAHALSACAARPIIGRLEQAKVLCVGVGGVGVGWGVGGWGG